MSVAKKSQEISTDKAQPQASNNQTPSYTLDQTCERALDHASDHTSDHTSSHTHEYASEDTSRHRSEAGSTEESHQKNAIKSASIPAQDVVAMPENCWYQQVPVLVALGILILAIFLGIMSNARYPLAQKDLTALGGGYDYFHYYATTLALNAGIENVYNSPAMSFFSDELSQGRWQIHDNHLPAFYLFYFNLSKLSFSEGFKIHTWLQLSLFAAGILALCKQSLRPAALAWSSALILVAASFFVGPSLDNIWLGQIGLGLTCSLCLTLVFYLRGHDAAAGICLSFAILAKMYPALLLLFFIKKKSYRVVFYTLLAIALLSLSAGLQWGFSHINHYLQALGTYETYPTSVANQSLMGPIAYWAQAIWPQAAALPLGLKLVHLLLIGFISGSLWIFPQQPKAFLQSLRQKPAFKDTKKNNTEEVSPAKDKTELQISLEFALWLVSATLVAPLSWSHHHMLLAIPFIVLLSVLASSHPSGSAPATNGSKYALWGLILISAIFMLEGESVQSFWLKSLHYHFCYYRLGCVSLILERILIALCLRQLLLWQSNSNYQEC